MPSILCNCNLPNGASNMKPNLLIASGAVLLSSALANPVYGQAPSDGSAPANSKDHRADVIVIPVGSQQAATPALKLPARGLKQSAVLAQFGEPKQRYGGTGNPPISRWQYPGFVVYFENGTVLHSVIVHVSQDD